MPVLREFGRAALVIATCAFGVQYLGYGHFTAGLPPVPPFIPGGTWIAYPLGVFLIAAALCTLLKVRNGWAALSLGVLFFFCAVFLHCAHLMNVLRDPVARTGALEPLALSGGFFFLSQSDGVLSGRDRNLWFSPAALTYFGIALFSLSMIVFGQQHFQYAAFIAQLIPGWIPGHLFWAYTTGIVFVLGGIGLLSRYTRPFAAASLGLMFFLWFVLLHLPRVVSTSGKGEEWTSAFVALGFSGASLILMDTSSTHQVE
jgi:uncharacterized membrane protein